VAYTEEHKIVGSEGKVARYGSGCVYSDIAESAWIDSHIEGVREARFPSSQGVNTRVGNNAQASLPTPPQPSSRMVVIEDQINSDQTTSDPFPKRLCAA
jgi:hypothetical protein